VILLAAGHLSTQSKEKTTRLIRAIADARAEPEPYHNLVLAAECVRDAGANRILGDLEADLRGRLQRELETCAGRGLLGAARTFEPLAKLSCGLPPHIKNKSQYRYPGAAHARGRGHFCNLCPRTAAIVLVGVNAPVAPYPALFPPRPCRSRIGTT